MATPEASNPVSDSTNVEKPSPEASGVTGEAMSAFIVGYTGEVGRQVVRELAKRNTLQKLVLIGRRKVEYKEEEIANNPAIEQVQVNFDELEKSKEVFEGLQVGFCCLGTTRGASGKEGQWKVDHDYVLKTAELAKEGGCKQFHLVSSKGADARSSLFYYKLKGQTEEDVKAVGFEKTCIYRPGVLLGEQTPSWLAKKVFSPFHHISPGNLTIATGIVAKAMINNIPKESESGAEIIDSKAIHVLGTE